MLSREKRGMLGKRLGYDEVYHWWQIGGGGIIPRGGRQDGSSG